MKVILLGAKSLDFTPDGESKAIKGTYIYFGISSENTIGVETVKKFISDDTKDVITIDLKKFINQPVNVEFGMKEKVVCVSA